MYRTPSIAIFIAALFAIGANAQTTRIEFPAVNASSFVQISAFIYGNAGTPTAITFPRTLGYRKNELQAITLTSAPFNTDSCRTVSFDIDLRTISQVARKHDWECLSTSIDLIDGKTGTVLPECTRAAGCLFKLDRVNADTTTTRHFTIAIPPGSPSTIQLRLAIDTFLMCGKPVVTTIITGNDALHSRIEMH